VHASCIEYEAGVPKAEQGMAKLKKGILTTDNYPARDGV